MAVREASHVASPPGTFERSRASIQRRWAGSSMAEQVTLNHLVEGSSPSRLTNARAWNGAHKAPFRRSRVIAGSEYQVSRARHAAEEGGARSRFRMPDRMAGWSRSTPIPAWTATYRDHHAPDRAGATEPTSARIGMRPPRIDAMQGALVIGALVIIDAEGRDLEGNGLPSRSLASPPSRWLAGPQPVRHHASADARRSRLRAHRGLACRPLALAPWATCSLRGGQPSGVRGSRAGIAGVEHGSRRGGLAAGRRASVFRERAWGGDALGCRRRYRSARPCRPRSRARRLDELIPGTCVTDPTIIVS